MIHPIEPLYEAFGRQVRRRRTALGWSQDRLGKALDPPLTRASIANIESGQQRVLLHTAVDLSRRLEVAIASLLRNDEGASGVSDPESLAAELADKLPISRDRARSLASKVARKNEGEKQ